MAKEYYFFGRQVGTYGKKSKNNTKKCKIE